jgi:hypothetical protein
MPLSLWTMVFAGFCYIESWQDSNYVAHSGIVHPDYRNLGLAKKIKSGFDYSLKKINAKVFGITTGLAVMKINSELGTNLFLF